MLPPFAAACSMCMPSVSFLGRTLPARPVRVMTASSKAAAAAAASSLSGSCKDSNNHTSHCAVCHAVILDHTYNALSTLLGTCETRVSCSRAYVMPYLASMLHSVLTASRNLPGLLQKGQHGPPVPHHPPKLPYPGQAVHQFPGLTTLGGVVPSLQRFPGTPEGLQEMRDHLVSDEEAKLVLDFYEQQNMGIRTCLLERCAWSRPRPAVA